VIRELFILCQDGYGVGAVGRLRRAAREVFVATSARGSRRKENASHGGSQ